jgi:hypothetical protein
LPATLLPRPRNRARLRGQEAAMPKLRKTGVPRAAVKTTKQPKLRTAAKTKSPAAPTTLDPAFTKVIQAFATDRKVTTGGKFGSTCLMCEGKVFVMLMKGVLVAKLPLSRVEELEEGGLGTPLVMGKRTMKEWVVVPSTKAKWTALAREAYAFVKAP